MKKSVLCLIAALYVFPCFGLVYASEGLEKISDHVYAYAGTKNPSPANSFGANAGIVIGDKGILVVDTLASAKAARRFIEDIRKISDKPIRYVVDTIITLTTRWAIPSLQRLVLRYLPSQAALQI